MKYIFFVILLNFSLFAKNGYYFEYVSKFQDITSSRKIFIHSKKSYSVLAGDRYTLVINFEDTTTRLYDNVSKTYATLVKDEKSEFLGVLKYSGESTNLSSKTNGTLTNCHQFIGSKTNRKTCIFDLGEVIKLDIAKENIKDVLLKITPPQVSKELLDLVSFPMIYNDSNANGFSLKLNKVSKLSKTKIDKQFLYLLDYGPNPRAMNCKVRDCFALFDKE